MIIVCWGRQDNPSVQFHAKLVGKSFSEGLVLLMVKSIYPCMIILLFSPMPMVHFYNLEILAHLLILVKLINPCWCENNVEYIAFASIAKGFFCRSFQIKLLSIKASIACHQIFGQIKAADDGYLHEHCVIHIVCYIVLAKHCVLHCISKTLCVTLY